MKIKNQRQMSTKYNTLQNTQRISNIENSIISVNDQNKFDINKQIKDKFKIFTNWNYRQISQKMKKEKKKQQQINQIKPVNQLFKVPMFLIFIQALISMSQKFQSDLKKPSKIIVPQQLTGMKIQRRQRFKKYQNPLQFIRHYIEKQNYKPNDEQMFLIEKIIQLKSVFDSMSNNIDLQKILQKIYIIMNLAVDCNQLKFLNLLIICAADICYQVKDYNRSFYFYNESRISATYAHLSRFKTQSLIGMALIALNLSLTDQATILFKKSLQYAWDSKDVQSQLLIYDFLGQCFYFQGKMKESTYYHTRYIQSQEEKSDSAIKKISNEMLNQYKKQINSLQQTNLTSLFIQYLRLPITNDKKIPVPNKIKKVQENYKNGLTPRITREDKKFDFDKFPDVFQQIQHLINEDQEFKTQIPNPDTHYNFNSLQKFGKKRKTLQFQQSSQFHRIIGTKPEKLNFQKIYKYPLQKRIQRALSEKKNPNWWEDIKNNTKKQKLQKVGVLKQKVRLGHLSYHKYPEERKRTQSFKFQKIKQSLNKTLLDWIDPVK